MYASNSFSQKGSSSSTSASIFRQLVYIFNITVISKVGVEKGCKFREKRYEYSNFLYFLKGLPIIKGTVKMEVVIFTPFFPVKLTHFPLDSVPTP